MSFGFTGLAPSGMSDVMSRITAIQSRFGVSGPVGTVASATTATANGLATTGAAGTDFAGALQAALGQPTASAGIGVTGDQVVADAKRYLGVPYVWGGTDPATGLDCSGLVQRTYGDLGIPLPRVAKDQAQAGVAVPSLAQARPGDLVAFGSPVDHIGIYVGNGQMLEAPHPGASVRIAPLPGDPVAIRRIVPDVTAGNGSGGYGALFTAAESRYSLPPGLLSAVARVESGMRPDAVSPAGAVGLMQLMPTTAASLGVDPRDPAQAVDGAARLLQRNLQGFGSLPLALAAYNAGPAAVTRYSGIPPFPETQNYVSSVLAAMKGQSA